MITTDLGSRTLDSKPKLSRQQTQLHNRFIKAVESEDIKQVKNLLTTHKINPNIRFGKAIEIALFRENREILECLLKHGGKIEIANIISLLSKPKTEFSEKVIDSNLNLLDRLKSDARVVFLQNGKSRIVFDQVENIRDNYSKTLRIALENGHLEVGKYLLDKKIHGDNIADIHAYDDYALRMASENGHLEVVKYLLDKKIHGDNIADIHADKDCALRMASRNGHLEVVKYLLDKKIHGDNIANIRADIDYALRFASWNGHLKVVKYLLDKKIHGDSIANIHADKDSALRLASQNGHLELVKYLLDKKIHGENIADIHADKDCALRWASENGHLEVVKYLLDKEIHGENIADIHTDKDYALRMASKKGHLEVVKYLLDKEIHGENIADIHTHNDYALRQASWNGYLEVVEYLLDKKIHGENIANIHADKDCALRVASVNGHLEVVKYLLDKEIHGDNIADIHAENDTALCMASFNGHLEVVKYLLDKKIHGENIADIHAEHDYALRMASENGHLEVVKYLLDKKIHGENIADIHAEHDYALCLASQNGHIEVVKYLLDKKIHGDNIANIHANKDYALLLASENNQLEVVSQLLIHFAISDSKNRDKAFSYIDENVWQKSINSAELISKEFSKFNKGFIIVFHKSCLDLAQVFKPESEALELANRFTKESLQRISSLANGAKPKNFNTLLDTMLLNYRESVITALGIQDMLKELQDAFFMGIEQRASASLSQDWEQKRKDCYEDAVELMLGKDGETRTLAEIIKWNKHWHKAHNRLAADCRPVFSDAKWDKLFDDVTVGELTVSCLTRQQELEYEGSVDQLDHCVGGGGYAQACQEGNTQIVSIRNGKSLATLELNKNSTGSIIDASGQRWAVKQFKGKKNTNPSEEAKAAWNEFVSLCDAKQVKFYSPEAVAQNDHSQIPEISRITGVYPQESPAKIIEHYLGMFMEDKQGNRIPLVKRGSYAFEIARFYLD